MSDETDFSNEATTHDVQSYAGGIGLSLSGEFDRLNPKRDVVMDVYKRT